MYKSCTCNSFMKPFCFSPPFLTFPPPFPIHPFVFAASGSVLSTLARPLFFISFYLPFHPFHFFQTIRTDQKGRSLKQIAISHKSISMLAKSILIALALTYGTHAHSLLLSVTGANGVTGTGIGVVATTPRNGNDQVSHV